MMTITVDLFGLPGAGKSTLAKAVEARAGPHFVNAATVTMEDKGPWGRRLKKLRLFLANGFAVQNRQLIWTAWRVRQSSAKNKFKSLSPLTTFLCLRAHFKARKQNALFDNGLLQSIYSVVYGAVNETQAQTAIDELTRGAVSEGHLHIIIDTPPSVCRTRVGNRVNNHSRLSPNDDANWEKSARYVNDIKDALMRRCAELDHMSHVLVVDGSAPTETTTQRVSEWIDFHLRERDHQSHS